jgi:hypothetical protein
MIEFTHATTRYTVKPENAQEYRRLAAKPPKQKNKVTSFDAKNDSMKRTYPEFYAGMTTRDYVTEYAAINSRLLLSETLFNYTDRAAPMLDAAQPEVLEELDLDYVPDFLSTTAKPKKQTVADLRRSIQSALDLLQAGDVDMAQCVLSESLK